MGQRSSQFQEYKREQKLRQNSAKIHGLSRALAVTAQQEKFHTSDPGWDELEQKKRSLRLLKGLFSELDAGVLPDRGINQGRVCLTLRYCPDRSLLLVRLVRCQGLRAPDVRSQVCHPIVQLRLVPDTSAQGEKYSKPSHLTCDPVFEELFAFTISADFLSEGRLFVEVWDYNTDGQSEFLGQSLVSLADHDLTDELPHTAWLNLRFKTELSVEGDLDISLSHESSEEGEGPVMSIKVNGASGLAEENQSTNVFVEVLIPGTPFKFHTKKLTSNTQLLWAETFQCNIPQSDFDRRFILFQVKCSGELSQGERTVGQAVIELEGFDASQTLHKTIPLSDLSNSDRLLEKLSQEPTTQEFREALRAHAVAANPGFLFQSHKGSKVVTLTARKAGSQARIKLQDGVPIYQSRE